MCFVCATTRFVSLIIEESSDDEMEEDENDYECEDCRIRHEEIQALQLKLAQADGRIRAELTQVTTRR